MARTNIKELKKIIEEKDKEIIALKAELERKSTELDKIVKVSSSVVSQLASTEDLLNLVVTVVAELLNTKICSVMLVDEEKQELIIRATQSLDEEYKNKPNLKVNQGISGLTVKEGRPVIVSDVREDPGFVYGDIARRLSLVSMLSVPMRFRNKVIGVINIYTSERHEFTTDEIEVVQALANYAGIAIGSSQLIEEVTKTREALETRKLVDRAKGFLMKSKGMSEDEAYRFLQKRSMDTGKPMKEIASAICLVYELEK